MQCFDTFRGYLHKLYAATMHRMDREGTYIFFSRRLGGSRWGQGIGHRGQLPPPPATPLAPPMFSEAFYFKRCQGVRACFTI